MNAAWSWGLSAVGVTALYLAGSGRRIGWALGLVAQVAWVVYAIISDQPGFIVASCAYGWVYARNLWIASKATA